MFCMCNTKHLSKLETRIKKKETDASGMEIQGQLKKGKKKGPSNCFKVNQINVGQSCSNYCKL